MRITREEDLALALRRLYSEVFASLPLMEPLCRREFGNTNYDLLMQRATEAQALLAKPPSDWDWT